jgi:signal transduction histidine kinase
VVLAMSYRCNLKPHCILKLKPELKILVLDDDVEDVELIAWELQKGGVNFQLKHVSTKESFVSALKEYNADVILSDHHLPQFDSSEALQLCYANKVDIPFILVSGAVSENFANDSIKEGVDDYILKTSLTRLPAAINKALKQHALHRAKLNADAELKFKNNQLLRTIEELSKINKELDTFVYSVSHNLRAPLMSVLGILNLVKLEDQHINNGALSTYHGMIEESILKLDETLKDILDYSRNARKDIRIERVDLNHIIRDNLERMRFMAGSENITQSVTIQEPVPFYSDQYRLAVVFNNLISNAIKYSDLQKKNSFIEIQAMVSKTSAHIEIKDNGIGINADYIAKVTEMFFRATDEHEGSGLGLYIVKEAVEKLHGTMTIESQLGIGTRFILDLPNFIPATMADHIEDKVAVKGQ